MKKRSKDNGRPGPAPKLIPGGVVRDLVDGNERRIAELEADLASAVRRAEEAELRVALLSGTDHAGPPDGGSPGANGSSAGRNGHAATPPRTTVVRRPRPPAAG